MLDVASNSTRRSALRSILLVPFQTSSCGFPSYSVQLAFPSSSVTCRPLGMVHRPVQRVPRYVMLLHAMMESTAGGAAERSLLRRALRAMKETAAYINNAVRGAEVWEVRPMHLALFPLLARPPLLSVA